MAIQKIPNTLIADNAVTAAKIANGTLTADDIAANSITGAKISATTSLNLAGLNTTGNVGIGTSSPANALEISTDGTDQLNLNRADSSININNTIAAIVASADDPAANKLGAKIGFTAGSSWSADDYRTNIIFSNDASGTMTERMRIDSSGNVTIGSSSLSANAALKFAADTGTFTLEHDRGSHSLTLSDSDGTGEILRVDTSGNLLVGKTALNNDDTGIWIHPNGTSWFTSTNDYPLGINRKSSNGTLITFTKDQGTVGIINNSGTNLGIEGHSGIVFLGGDRTGSVRAINSHGSGQPRLDANNDNTTDLGTGANRFKDLYLSGGVYLGGTAAANKLDDYEEGTWSPSLGNSANINSLNLTEAGRYVKVGNLVHVEFDVTGSFVNAAVESRFSFSLPFNTATTSSRATGMFSHLLTSFSQGRFNNGQVFQGTTQNSSLFVYISTNQLSGIGNFNGRATVTYSSA